MNKLKTNPQNQYKGLTEQEINEAIRDFAAYVILMLITVFGLMLICLIN